MKVQKSSRITALFLALVMILPLISIPTFAEPAQTPTPVWSQNFDGAANLGDVLYQFPKSASFQDGTLVIDRKATADSTYGLAVISSSRNDFIYVTAVEYADGTAWTGIENYTAGTEVRVSVKNGSTTYSDIVGVVTLESSGASAVGKCTKVTNESNLDSIRANNDWYIVQDTVGNAIVGNAGKTGSTVAREAYLKNPQTTPTNEKAIVLSAKYKFGTGFASGQIEGRTYGFGYTNEAQTTVNSRSTAIDLFIAKPSGNKVQIVKHNDCSDVLNGSIGVLVNKGEWIDLRFVIDVSGKCPMVYCYVNDDLAFVTAEDRAGNDWSALYGFAYLPADSWNLGHTSRGVAAKDLNNSTNNTFAVDNCAIYTSLAGFENEGYNFESDFKVYEQDFENLTVSGGKVQAGTDFAGVEGILTVETTEGNKWVKSEYGIIDNSNRDKNNMLKVPALSYKYFDWVKLEASYNIQLGKYAIGEVITQFRTASSSAGANKAWFDLYTLYVGSGNVKAGGTTVNGVLADGWNTVTMYLNLKTGQEFLLVNGDYVLSGSAGVTNIELFSSSEGYGKWTALKLDRSAMSYTSGVDYGYVGLDDASITCLNSEPKFPLYNQTFEKDTVNNVPAMFDPSRGSALVDPGKVVQEGSNKYWEFPISATNHNKHSYTFHSAVEHASTIVYQADNYISADAAGSVEARFVGAKGTFINADGTTIENRSVSWLTMYKLSYAAGNNTVTVTPGGNQNAGGVIVANNTFNKGAWAKITVVIDAVNGRYDIYLNNTLIIADVCFVPQYSNNGWIVGIGLKDVKLQANQLVYTPTSTANTGSIRLDNIALHDTTDGMTLNKTITPFAGYSEDFSTATPNVVNKNSGYADATVPSTVVDGAYCIPTDDDATANVNLVAKHASFNYLTAPKVVLEAKYTIPEGGSMQIQSQIFKAKAVATGAYKKDVSWIDLYTIKATDTSTAPTVVFHNAKCVKQLYKTEVARGQEFTVSMIIDLKTGDADLYVDGILYAEGCLPNGYAEVDAYESRWIIAKPNTNTTYTGNLLIDDAKITVLDESKLVDETGKGLVSAKVNGKLVKDATKFYGTVTEQKYLKASDYAGIVATDTELGSLRIGETLAESGLRFATKIDTAMMDELKAMLENGEIKALTFGTLIAPNAYITANGALDKTAYTVYDETANEGAGNFVSGKTVVDVQATKYSVGDVDANPETTHFVGSLVQILEKNYDRTFAARGYVEVTLHNGEVIFLGSATTATNSVQAQAEELIPLYAGNAEVLAILNAYAGN